MEVRLYELKEIESIIEKLLKKPTDIKTAYLMNKKLAPIISILETIEKNRSKLVQKYGVKTDMGGFAVPKEKTQDFMKEYSDLLSLSEDLKDFSPIPISWLDGLEISAIELRGFQKFVEEIPEDAKGSLEKK